MQAVTHSEAQQLFSLYMRVTDVPRLLPERSGDRRLLGKRLGIVNGAAWITLWSNYFGRAILPEVQLVNVGNEAVQLHFMQAHSQGLPAPPEDNIAVFARYAEDLVKLAKVDVILISCSTMNRSYPRVQEAVRQYGVPVIAIDLPMMEKAVELGGRVLLVATHGPTVENTRKLLEETADSMHRSINHAGATVEEAFDLLGKGDIEGHNQAIARAIRAAMAGKHIDSVVLAQLSMSVFKLSYPDCEKEFGVPVFTSGEEGFRRVREVLLSTGRES